MQAAASSLTVRPYRTGDCEDLGRVCIATGDAGADAAGRYFDDQLLPWNFAYPYVEYAPDLCWVAQRGGEVVGYVLGVDDVGQFARWSQDEWVPRFRARFPSELEMDPASERLRHRAENPLEMVAPYRSDYPAELHIDLTPQAQGQGAGRKLIETFVAELRRRGVCGLAIGVSARNTDALGFYDRMGFESLERWRTGEGYTLAMDLR